MVMRKRGDFFGLGTVPAVIVVTIAGMLIVFFGYKIADMSKDLSDVERCRISVAAKAGTTKWGMESPLVKSIKCFTRFIEVKEKGVYKRTREQKERLLYFFDSLGEEAKKEKVEKAIADEMHDCWYQMGEGKVMPWGTLHQEALGRCVICSQISFEKGIGEMDVGSFLANENIPGKGITYAKYLGYDESLPAKKIGTDETLNVVFIAVTSGAVETVGIRWRYDSLIEVNVPLETEGERSDIKMGIFRNEDVVGECSQLY